ncbi:hypothetical protein [Halorussus halobius]|uniref:hypothetical protein n=1 Tax=Halorussus halobius TaxID=1710537 RepID=UPI001092A782|nr:hypothetical protein [Halorussus halobius]
MHAALHRFALDAGSPLFALDAAGHWLALGLTFVATLAAGICAHELCHVVPLSFTNAEYTVSVLPRAGVAARGASAPTDWPALKHVLAGSLVRVEVTRLPRATPEWLLRAAALAPLALAVPFALVAAGLAPNPFATGDSVATVALVTVTACALPSPADWAVVWHGSDLYSSA